ncbi:MAG: HigA family addiction module antidote protein, partial [Chloroflexi bacterium]|nr:HigA family addiction module antidote protein [Chloroflexota bacterium]
MVTNFEQDIFSDLPIPPGELLEEEIAAIGMTQQELAMRTGRPAQVINEIVRGKKAITYETAIELEKVLGIPAHVWVNLEATYHLTQARVKERDFLLGQEDWLKEFPVRELEKRGWIQAHSDKADKIRALLEFFGVASFRAWRQTVMPLGNIENKKFPLGALAAWLRKGELEGRDIDAAEYDEEKFRDAIAKIRTMTSDEPEKFVPQMTNLCAEAGVAVVFVQELPK